MTTTPDLKAAALAQCDRAEALFNSLPDAEKAHHKEAGRFFPTSLIRTLIERLQVAEDAAKDAQSRVHGLRNALADIAGKIIHCEMPDNTHRERSHINLKNIAAQGLRDDNEYASAIAARRLTP